MLSRFCCLSLAAAGFVSAASAQSIDAFGLSNTALGNASIAYDAAARRLTVSNIGSSGQDGVEILAGETYALGVGWESIASTPDGASVEMRTRLNGLPPGTRFIGNRATHTGTQWAISGTALGLGVGGYTFLVLDHGQLTGRATVPNGGEALADAAPVGSTVGPTYKQNPGGGAAGTNCDPWETIEWYCTSQGGNICGVSWGNSPSAALSACCSASSGTLVATCGIQSFGGFQFAGTTTFTIGGASYLGDTILLEADVTGDEHSIASVDVIATGLAPAPGTGALALVFQKIEWDNKICANLGNSTISPNTGATGERRLPVNNLGSSGQDGVEIQLGRVTTWDVDFEPIDPSGSAPLGAYLDCVAIGILDGVPDQTLGSCRWVNNGFFDVFVDFTVLGSPTHRVVVLDHGTVLLDLSGQTGPVGSTSNWPTRIGKLGGALECFVASEPAGSQFLIAGGVYVGDEIRVLADSATATVSAKSAVQLRCADLGSITLRGVSSVGTDLLNGVVFCSGDGSALGCPCGNGGGAGRGCANSVNAAGALLEASGISSITNDSLVLSGSGMPNSSALYFQGTGMINGGQGSLFGDGLRCVGGAVIRFPPKFNVLGTSAYPGGLDPSVSVAGLITAPGGSRFYQVWYRNAAGFCTASTFNLSNGMRVEWGP